MLCPPQYYSSDGDTCSSIASDIGRVLGIESALDCSSPLPANTPVCITDSPNAVSTPPPPSICAAQPLPTLCMPHTSA